MILEELWRDEPCKRSMVSLATGADSPGTSSGADTVGGTSASAAAFRDYIGCTLNSLMYIFKVNTALRMSVCV